MKSPHSSWSARLKGSPGLAVYCAIISVFGLTGYYSGLLRGHIPDWVGVGLLMAPLAILVLIRWGEAPDRIVAMAHRFAAGWFMILALGMEVVGHLSRYNPEGVLLYRILAHLGWTLAWAGVYRKARSLR